MWQQKPDFAQHKEKHDGEGWLVNRDERLVIRIKPDKPTQHAQFVVVSTFRLQKPLGNPIREQRMLRHSGIMMWLELQKVGRRITKAESFSSLVVNLKTFHNYRHTVPRFLRNNLIFSFVTEFGPFIKLVVNQIDINVTRFSHPVGIGTPIKHLVAIVAAQYVVRSFLEVG